MPVNDTLTLTAGPVEITASGADTKKAPRVSIVAYTGDLIQVPVWGRVAFDLSGLEIGEQIPLLADHDASLEGVVGRGTARVVGGKELVIEGTLSTATDAGRQVIDLAREGHKLRASVGINPTAIRSVREGERVAVNGRTLVAPAGGFRLVEKGRLREVSILPLGADDGSNVDVAARHVATSKEHPMTLPVAEPVVQSVEELRAAQAAETDRIAGIRKICASGHAEIEAKAIAEGWDLSKAELAVLRAVRPKAPAVNVGARGASEQAVINAAAMGLMGRWDLAEADNPAAAEQARGFRHSLDLAAACVRASGQEPPRGTHALIRASLSTNALAVALGESGNRIAREALAASPPTITLIGNPMDLVNFKETKILSPVLRRGFEQMAPGGELHHANLEEELQTSVKADTYGEMFTVTLQDVMNDDLGTIPQLVVALTRNGARKLNDVGWTLVLANPSDWFGTGHGNLITGGTTVLSAEGLRQGIQAFRKQTDADGRPLDIAPAFLAVPPELEETGAALLSSTELARYVADGTDRQPTGNPYQGKLSLIVEPRLSNAAFTENSETAWFLFGPPGLGAVNIGYVGGTRAPTIEQVALPANVLGIGFRAYWDFAVALGEYRAALKSAGA
jgi:hypothetical protein